MLKQNDGNKPIGNQFAQHRVVDLIVDKTKDPACEVSLHTWP